jgi:hypothetical protein
LPKRSVIGLTVAVVAATAGVGAWLAYLVATIGIMFVAGIIVAMGLRHAVVGTVGMLLTG